ncbi:MAG: hypothetical protein K8F91_03700, partial [Candidatus Obscuribacterales bacterium]|nr:hypothetical protein [Candidatus Obscuribacterales bacterium]
MNEETASFCAECGQRFGVSEAPRQEIPRQTAPERAPEPPAAQGQAKKKKVKLHSPIFGDADEDDYEYEKDNLRSTGPRSQRAPNSGEKKLGKRGLRSPLLGADEDEEDDFEPSRQTRGSDSPGKAKKRRLRSPLLGEEDFDEPGLPGPQGPQAHKSHLRSPLLGGDDFDDYEEPPQPRSR